MNFELVPITDNDLTQYKTMLQESFQKGFENIFGKTEETILPDKDIEISLHTKGAVAYKAIVDGKMVGGAVVCFDKKNQHTHLDFLFVKHDIHNKGIGKTIWFELERLYTNTRVWETCTPYFDKRNIHFYVNVCGFHIVEFFNEKHLMPDAPEDFIGDANEGMFKFIKQL